jgi:hypothetical protein
MILDPKIIINLLYGWVMYLEFKIYGIDFMQEDILI